MAGCHPDMELSENDTKRDKMTFSSYTTLNNNGLNTLINNVNSSVNNTLGLIRNEELSKMFPTPPSIEQHTNSSPGTMCGNASDNLMEAIDMIASHKNDAYSNFGSPQEEPIDVSFL
jgi:mediator of RNA polymerase II transcription subunit 13